MSKSSPRLIVPFIAAAKLALACGLLIWSHTVFAAAPRERLTFDQEWRFALGHATDRAKDFNHATGYFSYLAKTGYGDGPAKAAFDDRGWRTVQLPHDWAVEVPFSPDGSHSHGYKAIGPGFPESSVGWYRKRFDIPERDLGRRISIEFEGIYRNARVFVNGFFVGEEPSGYLEQSYDLSEYLNYGGSNVIAVRVDASMEEGWYYEGAGIYRHAWLLKTQPLHVQRFGTFVTTSVESEAATVNVETKTVNNGRAPAAFRLRQSIFDDSGERVATAEGADQTVSPGETVTATQSLSVSNPKIWDLDTPNMHRLVTEVVAADGSVSDVYTTNFGIREIRFDPDRGFFLNGRHVKLLGTNNHQDHAGVGAAIPDALNEWRIRQLKTMGSNAYRSSHNPTSPALLDACDRLGMLVIDENRLMGINDYHLGQLERLMIAHRNHPSIILWSIGNEEWGIEGNITGARITRVMQDFAKRIDSTRPITAAISGGWGGISAEIEAMGFNYIRQGDTDKQHRDYPDRLILGTEETTTQQTRGIYVEDASKGHQPPKEDGSSGGNAEIGWKHYAAREFAAGIFYWTGFDYRGEPTPYAYPAVLSQFGILDNCGFPKDGYYYLKSWWTNEPVLHVFPHWNWPGREGQPTEVTVNSNCDEVELLLNGKSLGRKSMPVNGHLNWTVDYQPGTLQAKGFKNGIQIMDTSSKTTKAAASLRLTADRTAIAADGLDVSVVTVEAFDEDGLAVPVANNLLQFELSGAGRILGAGNGDPSCLESEQSHPTNELAQLGNWTGVDLDNDSKPVVFEAKFDLPDTASATRIELLLNMIGPEQTITLNGKTIDTATISQPIDLLKANLPKTGNVIRIVAQPFKYRWDREPLVYVKPATLLVERPAAPLKRSLFNGLAQVIVQSDGNAGPIELTASSDGLKPATLVIETK